MTDLEKKIRAKIPGEDTGIHIHGTICDICAPGPHCGVNAYIKDGKIIKIEGRDGHPAGGGNLCPKGQAGREYCYRSDRVLYPLKRTGPRGSGQFRRISWDEAYDEIAAKLAGLREKYGASSTAFFSGYEKWYRPFLQRLCYSFGSVNYGTESSACFKATVMSWKIACGVEGAGPDLGKAGVFLGWCCNPYHSSFLQAKALQKIKQRGLKIIIIDPRRTHSAEYLADIHLRPMPGTDGALALGMAAELIRRGWIDKQYIERHVLGFEEYAAYAADFTPERVRQLTGVGEEQLRAAVEMIHRNMPLAIGHSSAAGVHHINGFQNHRAMMALLAITGCYDVPGGERLNLPSYADSMGGFPTRDGEFARAVYPADGPEPVGKARFPLYVDLIGEMQAMDLSRQILQKTPYPIAGLVAFGMNYRMFPGSPQMKQALESLEFFVDTDLFLTDTAKLADIVLPACTSYERGEFKVYPGMVQYTSPAIEPLGQSKPDSLIITELARRIAPQDKLLCAGYDAGLREILSGLDIDLEELKSDSQHAHPLPGFRPILPGETGFHTPSGKFELYAKCLEQYPGLEPLPTYKPVPGEALAAEYPLLLSTARLPAALHSRCHDIPWLRSLRPRASLDISPEDAAALALEQGQTVRLSTAVSSLCLPVNISDRLPPGLVTLYHDYPEADFNRLLSADYCDPYSGFPGYNSVRCRVEKAEEQSHE